QTVPSQPLIESFAVEQEYFHNRSWLEPHEAPAKNETSVKSGAAEKGNAEKGNAEKGNAGPSLAVGYAALLNRAQPLLELEAAVAATTVDLDLVRADAKEAASDADRHAQLQAAIQGLGAKLAGQKAELQRARQETAGDLATFRGQIDSKKGSTAEFVPS